jgi:predicted aconitase with swiveling domain
VIKKLTTTHQNKIKTGDTMAKKTFKGRPLISGKLKGKALASKSPFNVSASYLENLFGGNTTSAPCTDVVNKEWSGKNLAGQILCFPTAVGSTMGGVTLMGVGSMDLGPKAMLYAEHVDSVSVAGLIIDNVWNDHNVITIDQLGDEFLDAVKTGDPISIIEDGTVEVG